MNGSPPEPFPAVAAILVGAPDDVETGPVSAVGTLVAVLVGSRGLAASDPA